MSLQEFQPETVQTHEQVLDDSTPDTTPDGEAKPDGDAKPASDANPVQQDSDKKIKSKAKRTKKTRADRKPSETGPNGDAKGQDAKGRFAPGNKLAQGNPYAKKAAALKSALFDAVGDKDLAAIVKKTVAQAKKGDRHARDFIFDRLLGKPIQTTDVNIDKGAAMKAFLGIDLDQV
jgi:hypothetical protein